MDQEPGATKTLRQDENDRGGGIPPAFYFVPTKERAIAMSFDDGPGLATPKFADILLKAGAKATFFVLTDNICKKTEGTLERLVREGHEIGIHSKDHLCMKKQNYSEIMTALQEASKKIEQVCGVRPTLCRPPFGDVPEDAIKAATDLGLSFVGWSTNVKDWLQKEDRRFTWMLHQLRKGGIVILHDCYGDKIRDSRQMSQNILSKCLDTMATSKHKVLTVSQLVSLWDWSSTETTPAGRLIGCRGDCVGTGGKDLVSIALMWDRRLFGSGKKYQVWVERDGRRSQEETAEMPSITSMYKWAAKAKFEMEPSRQATSVSIRVDGQVHRIRMFDTPMAWQELNR